MFGFLRRKRPPTTELDQASSPAPSGGTASGPDGIDAFDTGRSDAERPGRQAGRPDTERRSGAPGPALSSGLATATPVEVVSTPAAPERRSWLQKLRGGLARTRTTLTQLFTGSRVDEALYEALETALLASDAGVATTEWLLEGLRHRAREQRIEEGESLKAALRQMLT